jgi:hypothetical protein
MNSSELDQKYTSAGSTHEEYRKWIARLPEDADDTTVLRTILSTMGQMESVLMGIYAELVYARHSTPVVAAVPAKLQKKPSRDRSVLPTSQREKRART